MTFSSLALILLMFLPPMTSQAVGQETGIQYDSTGVDVRRPPADMLEDFRGDLDYRYATEQVRSDSWWDQLVDRFFRWLDGLFEDTNQGSIWRYVLYGAAIVAVIFAVLQIFKMDGVRLFQIRTRRPQGMYEGISEVLHENDFLELARGALEKEDYREAARMYFMHVLRVLDEKGDIDWAPRKTNRDYVRECRHSNFRPAFERLAYLFDYSWYGNFPVDTIIVDEMRTLAEKIENAHQGNAHQNANKQGVVQ